MIHSDGTMDVRVNGQMERRVACAVCNEDGSIDMSTTVPHRYPNERIYHVIGSDVPNILTSDKWLK